jgi:hypothetical protein
MNISAGPYIFDGRATSAFFEHIEGDLSSWPPSP